MISTVLSVLMKDKISVKKKNKFRSLLKLITVIAIIY